MPNIATNLLKSRNLPINNKILQDRKIGQVKYVLLSIGNQKKDVKKIFFLSGPAFTPSPLLVVRLPLRLYQIQYL